MPTVEIQHHFAGGAYAKQTRIPAGHVLVQHRHRFDHLSILASGSVLLEADGVTSRVDAPACLEIPAGTHHGVRALTDVVWFCVHATDCADEDAIDEVLILPADEAVMADTARSLASA